MDIDPWHLYLNVLFREWLKIKIDYEHLYFLMHFQYIDQSSPRNNSGELEIEEPI